MWTSKLGNKYPMAWMQQNDQAAQKELKQLRSLSGNSTCADCGRQDNSWASVSHGVFICVTCSDVHRSVGTHITKVKGCTGTYLWGPDELERMQTVGNRGGDDIYGAEKVDPGASKERKQRYVVEKYEARSFAGKPVLATAKADSTNAKVEQQKATVRRAEQQPPAGNARTSTMARSSQQCLEVKATVAPVAKVANISNSLFDELFNEADDNFFGNYSAPLKSRDEQIVQCAVTSRSDIDNSLDAFLNTTLHVNAQPAPLPVSKYPANLDPFQSIQVAPVTDPFHDWPEF